MTLRVSLVPFRQDWRDGCLGDGVSLHGLTKSFGDVEAVRGIDVSIDLGETVALLGPNGAGKSTTIDMLLGLLEPDDGAAHLLGGSPQDAVAAGRVGAMLQVGSLTRDLSVRELISMVASPGAGLEDAFVELTGVEYIRYELLRTVRNRRFTILALGFPLVLYFLIAAPNRHEQNLGDSGISSPLYERDTKRT